MRPGGAGGAGHGRRARGAGRGDDPTAGLVRALAVYEGPEWVVDSVLLTESRPGEGRGGGPLYVDQAVFPVGSG